MAKLHKTTQNIVFLPIKPKWANMIMTGEKTAELRKNNFPLGVKRAVIYSTMPEGKILGWIGISEVKEMHPDDAITDLFDLHRAGLIEFSLYYKECQKARIAMIDQSDIHIFKYFHHPDDLFDIENNKFKIPQSFCYLNDFQFNWINACGNNVRAIEVM